MTPKIPKYRRKMVRGRPIGYLTLSDSKTKKRRDFHLGPYDSDESRAKYLRLVAEWESRGRRLAAPEPAPGGRTVAEICAAYWREMKTRGYSQSHLRELKRAITVFRQYHSSTVATEFGPNALRVLRDAMVRGDGEKRPPWHPGTASQRTRLIVGIWKWAVSRELLPADAWQRLRTLEPLRYRSEPVKPVSLQAVEAVRPHLSRHVLAMVDLQLLTGMRSGEVCAMRPCDLDMSGKVWMYRMPRHKTSYRGRERVVPLGPRAQELIEGFLAGRPTSAYMFSPAEAEAERRDDRHRQRKTPLSCGNRPGTNRAKSPRRPPGEQYTADSYRRAIDRACKQAGITSWHPHQLRHTYATEVRKQYGLEAAQILLGHSSALVTDAVYAQRDMSKASEIAQMIG